MIAGRTKPVQRNGSPFSLRVVAQMRDVRSCYATASTQCVGVSIQTKRQFKLNSLTPARKTVCYFFNYAHARAKYQIFCGLGEKQFSPSARMS